MTGNVRAGVNMDEEWFQSVLKRDYVKVLDSTEAEMLEGILDMELSYKAAESGSHQLSLGGMGAPGGD